MQRLFSSLAFALSLVLTPLTAHAQATIDALSLDVPTCGPLITATGFEGRLDATITIDDCSQGVHSTVSTDGGRFNQCLALGVGTHPISVQYIPELVQPNSTMVATLALVDDLGGQVLDSRSVSFNCTTGGPGACTAAPRAGCRTAGVSKFRSKSLGQNTDRFSWTWAKGEATTQAEFGDPTDTTDYALCIYQDGEISGASDFFADGDWGEIKDGYKRKATFFAEGNKLGIESVKLKGGADGKSKIVIRQKQYTAPQMHFPVAVPLTVQLVNLDSDLCFESVFDADDIGANMTLGPFNDFFAPEGFVRGVAK